MGPKPQGVSSANSKAGKGGASKASSAIDAVQTEAKKADTAKTVQAPAAAPAPQAQATSNYLQIDPTLIERTGLNVEQLQELIEIFQLVDIDHGGTISTDELEALMKTVGLRATQSELNAMVKELDHEDTGEIDFESFVGAMSRKVQTSLTTEEIRKAFRAFAIYDDHGQLVPDTNDVNSLPTSSVVGILTNWGEPDRRLTPSEALEMVRQVKPYV
ncbi:Calmodulin-3 [Cladochytrium tenue]|nr:Calmodulin-3 [Cladochytrium tenue]